METIVKNDVMVLGLKDLFKSVKQEFNYNEWYKALKVSEKPESEIANLINIAKENTYKDKIFKATNVIFDEDKELIKIYKIPDNLYEKTFTNVLTKKSIEFMEFTNFIVWNGIENEDNLCFINLEDYRADNFKKAIFAIGENEVWNALESTIKMDYGTMEKCFKSVRYENDDTCIVEFNNRKEYVVFLV